MNSSKYSSPTSLAFAKTASLAAVLALSADCFALPITVQANGLTINATGMLDMEENFLIIRAPDVATKDANLVTITAALKTGINLDGLTGPPASSFWQGYGIHSSLAAANPSLFAVGVLDNGLLGPGTYLYGFDGVNPGPLGAAFGGVANLTGLEILIRYTYTGDADLNGFVDSADQTQFDNGFNSNLSGWVNGDFNYNVDSNTQDVGPEDQTQFDNGFNSQGAPLPGFAPSGKLVSGVVPEPASTALVAFGVLCLTSSRRFGRSKPR